VLQVNQISENIFFSVDYFTLLMQILNYNPIPEDVLSDLFKSVGLSSDSTFDASALPDWAFDAFNDSISIARNEIIPFGYQYATGIVAVNSWQGGTKNGRFDNEFLRRAFSSFSGPAANVPEEQYYITTVQDSSLSLLDGSISNYKIHFNAGSFPDLNSKWGYWSIGLYTTDLFLYPNSINRYAVGSNNHDLLYNTDGSLDIYIQHSQPIGSDPSLVNWLPCPASSFRLIFRMFSASSNQIFYPTNLPSVDQNN